MPPNFPFHTVLVANRGEIAVRLIKGIQKLGLRAATVFTAADSASAHVSLADIAISLGEAWDAYLDIEALVNAGKEVEAGGVCPGYGFVSENPEAAYAFEQVGITWIGPSPETIDLFGLKHTARAAAESAGVPIVPGSPLLNTPEQAPEYTEAVGFPALIKASAGGGGMGQAIAYSANAVPRVYQSVVSQGQTLFKNSEVYVERFIEHARHIEVQVFGDGRGNVVAIGERDCSVQRRRQKVIEEGPATDLGDETRNALRKAAITLCAKHNYRSAGTVEFILDAVSNEWYFLEVNTRLQVEHGVTELVSGIDIVEWMILLAGGIDVLQNGTVQWKERGCAIEVRLYAENPVKDYQPCPGQLSEMVWPETGKDPTSGSIVRVDYWAKRGISVSSFYDPLLGKILTWGRTRDLAIDAMNSALAATVVHGVPTNLELLRQTLKDPEFTAGKYTTNLLSSFSVNSTAVEVIVPGLQTSLQDYPGRIGYWNVGVSPSGAMDAYSMCMANAMVGNPVGACAMEITVRGPTLKFHAPAIVALTGCHLETEMDDGKPVKWWSPFRVDAGSVLRIGGAVNASSGAKMPSTGSGKLSYLAVRGGFDAPCYLGSSSTFPTGNFGGIHGGFLKGGDFIPMIPEAAESSGITTLTSHTLRLLPGWPLDESLPSWLIPEVGDEIVVGAINGPHGSNDFFHDDSLLDIWNATYTVHHAANRLGVRLIGPSPKWTRSDGGSAGLHPSNLHDYTYAPGAVNFSGNTPIVLMMDGPSLGGFVCPITIATCELWKIAQAKPGSTVRFKQIGCDEARISSGKMHDAWDAVRNNDSAYLNDLHDVWSPDWIHSVQEVRMPAIVAALDPNAGDHAEIKVVYRMSGDEHLLIEYGEIELDLAYRMRVHTLMEELKALPYIRELCPGVRSLLVRYDPSAIRLPQLLSSLKELEIGVMGAVEDVVVPSRVIRLPLAFDDGWTREAQQRYLISVRPDAPYMPSNVEFVRRINGLDSIEDVKAAMISAEYCVLGLGDVYLGAPCAVPLDPRHRLVTSKYNPARTYTPEGAVGIGGAYLCIYGMDSPGGYQLCGRTLPIWDNYGSIPETHRGSPPDVPWLLRFFDRICFYPVSDTELEDLRARYRRGDLSLDISNDTLSFKEYMRFIEMNEASIRSFQEKQQAAFSAERARWEESGEGESDAAARHATKNIDEEPVRENGTANINQEHHGGDQCVIPVSANVASNVWSVEVAEGEFVSHGQTIFILETMKVEVSVEAPFEGIIKGIQVSKGDYVFADTQLCNIVFSQDQAMDDISIGQLREMYRIGIFDPAWVMSRLAIAAERADGVFVSTTPSAMYSSTIEQLKSRKSKEYLPLYGIPFVVSDDFDVAGTATSHGCSSYQRHPTTTAQLIKTLQDAGALLLGKTNLDQFGAGLTGTQSSFGIVKHPFAPDAITGSSSGAAVAVASGLATFAICVDSAGSALVSASLVGAVSIKLTEGLLSLCGVSPSCPSLDCITIIASTPDDIETVLRICIAGRGLSDASLRKIPSTNRFVSSEHLKPASFVVGVPLEEQLEFDGDEAKHLESRFHAAIQRLQRHGVSTREVDCAPFRDSSVLYESAPLDAARCGAHGTFVRGNHLKDVFSSVSNTILRGEDMTAVSYSTRLYELQQNQRSAEMNIWPFFRAIAVPAVPRFFTAEEASRGPEHATLVLGRYLRFITPMDLCALTLTSPVESDATVSPGIVLIAPAFHEADLLELARIWEKTD